MTDPAAIVSRFGGVARVEAVAREGVGRRAMEHALASGALQRVRRGWVALPDADRMLRRAAECGVVLTCVTQGRRLGLWVLDDAAVHVAAPARSGHAKTSGVVAHWNAPLVPRHPGVLEDPVENVLAMVAGCQPYEIALAIFESALRRQLVDKPALSQLPLRTRARELLEAADIYSDSGLETIVVPRLRWLRLPLRRQVWIAGHRVDLLIGDRLVLQIDGATHVGRQRESDIAHDAALTLLGYHVIRVGYHAVIDHWPDVQDTIMRAVAQGLHRAH